jgi:hypothetical protein
MEPRQYRQISQADLDEKPGLENETTSFLDSGSLENTSNHRVWVHYRSKAILLHVCFLAIHLALAALSMSYYNNSPSQPCGERSLIHSPANDILQHVRHVYNGSDIESYYIQPPSPEIDDRWQNLVLGNFIRLSQDDLREVGRLDSDPVLLEDGSGVGLLNSHHEIHCIMGLYQGFHPEYYWPNATEEQQAGNRHHIDHCLDYLLQASMCHGDVGFMTYHWDMEDPVPYWKAADHTCVDFEGLRSWMMERKVAIHEPGFLVHPKFGPPYPDGVEKIPTIND